MRSTLLQRQLSIYVVYLLPYLKLKKYVCMYWYALFTYGIHVKFLVLERMNMSVQNIRLLKVFKISKASQNQMQSRVKDVDRKRSSD